MEQWGQTNQIPVKDLLPEMDVNSQGQFQNLFLSCDGHWSPYGNKVAADALQKWLTQVGLVNSKN